MSVDSNAEFLEGARRSLGPSMFSRTTLVKADVGPTGAWGRPLDTSPSMRPAFRNYSRAVWTAAPEVLSYDLYLVDGRFRPACVAQAFLHAARDGRGPADFVVAVHDFGGHRGHFPYVHVLKIAERFGGAGPTCDQSGLELGLLRRRADVDDAAIWRFYEDWVSHVHRRRRRR